MGLLPELGILEGRAATDGEMNRVAIAGRIRDRAAAQARQD